MDGIHKKQWGVRCEMAVQTEIEYGEFAESCKIAKREAVKFGL